MPIIKGTSTQPKKRPKKPTVTKAQQNAVGGRSPLGSRNAGNKQPPVPTWMEVIRDPKTTGNSVTGTSRYRTPYSTDNLYSGKAKGRPEPEKSLRAFSPGAGPNKPLKGKPKPKPKPKPRGGGGGGGGGGSLDEPLKPESVYAEADLATTSYLRTQGKAYAAGREGSARARAGLTGGGKKKEEEEKEGGGKRKGRKKKGLLKTRGNRQQSGVKANFHISKSGKVVPNRGGRKAKPQGK